MSSFVQRSKQYLLSLQSVVITSSDLPEGRGTHLVLLASAPWGACARAATARLGPHLHCCPRSSHEGAVEDEWSTTFAHIDRATHPHAVLRVDIPRIACSFTGTGDLMAALLLAHTQVNMEDCCTVILPPMRFTLTMFNSASCAGCAQVFWRCMCPCHCNCAGCLSVRVLERGAH